MKNYDIRCLRYVHPELIGRLRTGHAHIKAQVLLLTLVLGLFPPPLPRLEDSGCLDA
jgi:hypothetical protein